MTLWQYFSVERLSSFCHHVFVSILSFSSSHEMLKARMDFCVVFLISVVL